MFNLQDSMKAIKDQNYWDEGLMKIDDECMQDHQVYGRYIATFNTFVSSLRAQLELIAPNLKVYHKKHHIGRIHYISPNEDAKPYSLNLFLIVDVSNVICKVIKNQGHVTLYTEKKSPWTDQSGRFDQEKFYLWVENILPKTITQMRLLPRMSEDFSVSRTGQDLDLFIQKNEKEGFTVRVIPALVYVPSETLDMCFAVVDRNYFKRGPQIPATSWRLTYPTREERIIKDEPILRMSIRFVKLIRDSYEMSYVPSYAIKMLFMSLTGGYGNADFFRQSLTNILKRIISRLQEKIAMKNINDAWDHQYNVLKDYNITELQFEDCLEKLKAIANRMEDQTDDIEKILFNISIEDDVMNKTTTNKSRTTHEAHNPENEFIKKMFGSDATRNLKREDMFTKVFPSATESQQNCRQNIFEGLYKFPEFTKSEYESPIEETEKSSRGNFINKLFSSSPTANNPKVEARQFVKFPLFGFSKNKKETYQPTSELQSFPNTDVPFKSASSSKHRDHPPAVASRSPLTKLDKSKVKAPCPRLNPLLLTNSYSSRTEFPMNPSNLVTGSLTASLLGSMFGMSRL